MTIMETNNVIKGLVAYFDILGFGQMIDIKSDEDFKRIRMIIRRTLVNFTQIQNASIEKSRGALFHNTIESCSFADSILLWCKIAPTELEGYYWNIFFQLCGDLMNQYFNDGLPLRGAISHGKFYIEDHCFAGKPIKECYKWGKLTEWAGCVVVPEATEHLEKLWSDPKEYGTIMQQICLRYETPLKKNRPGVNPLLVIKWSYYDLWHPPDDPFSRIPDAVLKSFTQYGKKIPPEAEPKRANTVQFLTYVAGLCANSNTSRDNSLT